MKKYNLPLTYKPKIQPVREGKCTQTIRIGSKFQVGDLISFHGWEGKPYRSKWSFRTPYFKVTHAAPITITQYGIVITMTRWADDQSMEPNAKMAPVKLAPHFCERYLWDSEECNLIAGYDGIDPPTGIELGKVLTSYHKIPDEGLSAQIIRWTWTE